MSLVKKSQILNFLAESAREASELYSDNPLDYKGHPVTPDLVQAMGNHLHYADMAKIVLENYTGEKILDVGIAYGFYGVVIKRILDVDIYGVDHPANLNSYCRYPVHKGIQVESCDLHFEDLPYPENCFDTVIASEIIEHLLISPKAFFKKLYVVLKPGGKFIITTPNFASLVNVIQIIRCVNPAASFPDDGAKNGQQILDQRVHPREYTVKEIASALEDTGFIISKIQTIREKVETNTSWRLKLLYLLMGLTPKHREKIIAVGTKQAAHFPADNNSSQ